MKVFPVIVLILPLVLSSCIDLFENEKEEVDQTVGDSAIDRKKKLEEMELKIEILEWENSRLSYFKVF